MKTLPESASPRLPTESFQLPRALLSANDPAAEEMIWRAQKALRSFPLQRALLGLADIFSSHPSLRFIAIVSVDHLGHDRCAPTILTNRGGLGPDGPAKRFSSRLPLDPDADATFSSAKRLDPDWVLSAAVRLWLNGLDSKLGSQLCGLAFEPDPALDPLPQIMLQGLGPELFASWQSAFLESQAPTARSDDPPALKPPRL